MPLPATTERLRTRPPRSINRSVDLGLDLRERIRHHQQIREHPDQAQASGSQAPLAPTATAPTAAIPRPDSRQSRTRQAAVTSPSSPRRPGAGARASCLHGRHTGSVALPTPRGLESSGPWTPDARRVFAVPRGQRVPRSTDGAVPRTTRARSTRRSELHQSVPGSAAVDMRIGAAYSDFTNLDARRFVREGGTSFVSPSYRRIARTNPTTAATAAALVIVSAPLKIALLIEAPSSLAKPSPPVTRPATANAIQPYRSHPRSLITPAERPPSNTGCVFRPSSSTAQHCLADGPSPQDAAGTLHPLKQMRQDGRSLARPRTHSVHLPCRASSLSPHRPGSPASLQGYGAVESLL
jgi:hypothetical protein